jgi:hypothetical protein
MTIALVLLCTLCDGNARSLREHTSDYWHSDAVTVNSLAEKKHAQSVEYFTAAHEVQLSVYS